MLQGDSGSVLVIKDGDEEDRMAIGVLSTAPKDCNEKVIPSIYTNVSSYLDFIENAKNDIVTRNMRASEPKKPTASSSQSG